MAFGRLEAQRQVGARVARGRGGHQLAQRVQGARVARRPEAIGRLEPDNNTAENAIRPLALGRNNAQIRVMPTWSSLRGTTGCGRFS